MVSAGPSMTAVCWGLLLFDRCTGEQSLLAGSSTARGGSEQRLRAFTAQGGAEGQLAGRHGSKLRGVRGETGLGDDGCLSSQTKNGAG